MPLLDHFRPPLASRHHWESFLSNWSTRIADRLIELHLTEEFIAYEFTKYPDRYEVEVRRTSGTRSLVGAIEIVGPHNKLLPEQREAFALKIAGYLRDRISVVVMDIVTTCRADLHGEVMKYLNSFSDAEADSDADLRAVAYRPVVRGGCPGLEEWSESLRVGYDLPTMPLWLTSDTCVPVESEVIYREACRSRRLA